MPDTPVILHHNFNPGAFMWLWAKYVTAPNLEKHCTASLKSLKVSRPDGKGSSYSQKFSAASNPAMRETPCLVMDENGAAPYTALYLCGVASAGYAQKKNYPHNFHAAVVPAPGKSDTYEFEGWKLSVENGLFTRIPAQEELPAEHAQLSPEYVTCRIFRWAACVLPHLVDGTYQHNKQGLHPSL